MHVLYLAFVFQRLSTPFEVLQSIIFEIILNGFWDFDVQNWGTGQGCHIKSEVQDRYPGAVLYLTFSLICMSCNLVRPLKSFPIASGSDLGFRCAPTLRNPSKSFAKCATMFVAKMRRTCPVFHFWWGTPVLSPTFVISLGNPRYRTRELYLGFPLIPLICTWVW